MNENDKKLLPHIASDDQAEPFVDTTDVSAYDLSAGREMHFEMERWAAVARK